MAVKVLIIVMIVSICFVHGDVSHLNVTPVKNEASENLETSHQYMHLPTVDTNPDLDQTTTDAINARLSVDPIQSRNAIFETELDLNPNGYAGVGYSYIKPRIPFETVNVNYGGYEYPKPINPMTYPPPEPQTTTTTDQTFPEATARLRISK